MLVRGEIDLFGNVSYTPERVELVEFSAYPQGKDTYRMYTSKNRTDLATGDIQKINGCRIGVTEGSYQAGASGGLAFNAEEKEWLEAHDSTIRLGYFDDNLPFTGEEKGELTGILAAVLETLEREYGIRVEAVPYGGMKQMEKALHKHKTDAAGSVIRDFCLTEQDDLVLTDSIVETTPVIIYKGDPADDRTSGRRCDPHCRHDG